MKQIELFHLQYAISYLTDLGKNELHSPDLTLAAETVLSANAEFLVQTLTLVGATRSAEGQTVYSIILFSIVFITAENNQLIISRQPNNFIRLYFTYSFCDGHK